MLFFDGEEDFQVLEHGFECGFVGHFNPAFQRVQALVDVGAQADVAEPHSLPVLKKRTKTLFAQDYS